MLASFLQINLCSKCCTTLLINTPPHFRLSLSTGTKQDRDRWTKKKSPTTDVEEDEPRSVASLTSAHYSSVIPLLLFILFIVSLSTVSCISLLPSIKLYMYLVRSFQAGWLLARSLFSGSLLAFPAIAAHVVDPPFSPCPQGSYETRDWCLRITWGSFEKKPGAQKRQMRSRSHMQQLAQLGRKDRAVARAPIKAPQILLPFLPSLTPSVLYEPFHTAD